MKAHGSIGWKAQRHRRQKRKAKIQAMEDRKAEVTRRVFATAGGEDTIYRRAAMLGMTLELADGGKHWVFRDPGPGRGGCRFVEWWPRRGRLVFDRDYGHPVFTQVVIEALRLIAERRTMA